MRCERSALLQPRCTWPVDAAGELLQAQPTRSEERMANRYDPDRNHRRSIRLKGYNYIQPGAYFVTVCTHQRENLLDQPPFREVAKNA